MLRFQDSSVNGLVSPLREPMTHSNALRRVHARSELERRRGASLFVQSPTDNNMAHREATGQRQEVSRAMTASKWPVASAVHRHDVQPMRGGPAAPGTCVTRPWTEARGFEPGPSGPGVLVGVWLAKDGRQGV